MWKHFYVIIDPHTLIWLQKIGSNNKVSIGKLKNVFCWMSIWIWPAKFSANIHHSICPACSPQGVKLWFLVSHWAVAALISQLLLAKTGLPHLLPAAASCPRGWGNVASGLGSWGEKGQRGRGCAHMVQWGKHSVVVGGGPYTTVGEEYLLSHTMQQRRGHPCSAYPEDPWLALVLPVWPVAPDCLKAEQSWCSH